MEAHVLSQSDKEIINRNISLILCNPQLLTSQEYIQTYNTVYTYCTKITKHYCILGDDIYRMIDESLKNFADKLEFKGSISLLASQMDSFRKSIDLLQMVFNYLERFYIRTSIINQHDVKKLNDLFLYQIYFNYIYKIEYNLQNLILLEIETYRKAYKHDFSDLKTVISFYIDCLDNNELDTDKRKFLQRYFQEFKDNFDFNVEISKLLKKIYLEMYFVTNILGDKDMSKDVIQTIFFRKDEILEYAFELIRSFDKFKHVYAIVTMMPESFKNQFKFKYEEFLSDFFANSHTFEEMYSNFMNVKTQIDENKLGGYNEIADNLFKKIFLEKSTHEQAEIHLEMVKFIDGAIHTYNKNMLIKEDDFAILFDMFSLVFEEYLIGMYTESVQMRLLKGMNVEIEEKLGNMILERVGWSNASGLKNTIMSFVNKTKLLVSYNEVPLLASYVKITKGFWNLEKNEPNLHPLLYEYKTRISSNIDIPERHRLEFNFKVSPLVFILNNTKYRMNSDVASLLFLVIDGDSVSAESLREFSNDPYFDESVDFLIKHEFICKSVDPEGIERLRALNKCSDQQFIDLFKIPKKKVSKTAQESEDVHLVHILESKICKIMKRAKEMNADLLKREFPDESSFDNILSGLVSKGYLELVSDTVRYLP